MIVFESYVIGGGFSHSDLRAIVRQKLSGVKSAYLAVSSPLVIHACKHLG